MFGKPKPCTVPSCGSKYHQTWQHTNPATQMQPRTPLKSGGRLRPEAKKTRAKRIESSNEWLELNPPDEHGHWICYLQIVPECPIVLTIKTMRQEHVFSKARRRDLKYDVRNRRPACDPCNKYKGSRNANELLSPERYAALNMEVS